MREAKNLVEFDPLITPIQLDTNFLERLEIILQLSDYFNGNRRERTPRQFFLLHYSEKQKDPDDYPKLQPTLFAFSWDSHEGFTVSSTPLEELLHEQLCSQKQYDLLVQRFKKRSGVLNVQATINALNTHSFLR